MEIGTVLIPTKLGELFQQLGLLHPSQVGIRSEPNSHMVERELKAFCQIMREAIVQEETELGLTAGTDTKLTSEQGSSGTAVVRRTVDTMADL
ncbi:hypothetical protein Y1Q_0005322 [Alligator mississippiensis]|uniref:Uncharacterized protein n=1 Tax=Alligator mississippiensis TaxID=8496 RepID=A0A151MVE2_ALLMI|nr:hypothetical protein Y1Q_0005322 [Alligator mississippiensis]